MYRFHASRLAGPTEKAPYPPCHEKPFNAGDYVLSHFEEEVLNSSTRSAMVMVREMRMARWT
jgi:hypothetical protein